MRTYKAPVRDMRFVLNEMLKVEEIYRSHGFEEADADTINMILEEGSKFASEVLTPLSKVGDQHGCTLHEDGSVTTPPGFKEAYQQYVENGWGSMCAEPKFGGQGLPDSLGQVLNEMIFSADISWGMYPGLSHGAMNALMVHGTEEQQHTYLSKLVEGSWTGTMCLTESHCGSDLGLLRTRAEPHADGSYRITGEKIFISSGDHDMAENIVHLVLARLPDAPKGTKGISLFIVPKFLPDEQGGVGERNGVRAAGLEEKMGIKANATCVMVFEDAVGYMVGEPNQGLRCMFTMMNAARLGTGIQGLGVGEASYQGALTYAKERLQMRSLSGPKHPDKPADPIIVHPDVRRMLLTQKSIAEGCRALAYYTATVVDTARHAKDQAERDHADKLLHFLTPICKAFMTESGYESVNLGMQIYGGHGFIKEWGMEQLVRDARITLIYEGTTGIQSLDLLGRKVLMTNGETLREFTKIIYHFCKENGEREDMKPFVEPLAALIKEWGELTTKIGMAAMQDREEVGAASVDYLMYSGYACLAYFWAWMAQVALDQLAAGSGDEDFYRAKVFTARFYYRKILPRTRGLAATMLAGAPAVMDLEEEHFSFL